jgi:hypothetical protein
VEPLERRKGEKTREETEIRGMSPRQDETRHHPRRQPCPLSTASTGRHPTSAGRQTGEARPPQSSQVRTAHPPAPCCANSGGASEGDCFWHDTRVCSFFSPFFFLETLTGTSHTCVPPPERGRSQTLLHIAEWPSHTKKRRRRRKKKKEEEEGKDDGLFMS